MFQEVFNNILSNLEYDNINYDVVTECGKLLSKSSVKTEKLGKSYLTIRRKIMIVYSVIGFPMGGGWATFHKRIQTAQKCGKATEEVSS